MYAIQFLSNRSDWLTPQKNLLQFARCELAFWVCPKLFFFIMRFSHPFLYPLDLFSLHSVATVQNNVPSDLRGSRRLSALSHGCQRCLLLHGSSILSVFGALMAKSNCGIVLSYEISKEHLTNRAKIYFTHQNVHFLRRGFSYHYAFFNNIIAQFRVNFTVY